MAIKTSKMEYETKKKETHQYGGKEIVLELIRPIRPELDEYESVEKYSEDMMKYQSSPSGWVWSYRKGGSEFSELVAGEEKVHLSRFQAFREACNHIDDLGNEDGGPNIKVSFRLSSEARLNIWTKEGVIPPQTVVITVDSGSLSKQGRAIIARYCANTNQEPPLLNGGEIKLMAARLAKTRRGDTITTTDFVAETKSIDVVAQMKRYNSDLFLLQFDIVDDDDIE